MTDYDCCGLIRRNRNREQSNEEETEPTSSPHIVGNQRRSGGRVSGRGGDRNSSNLLPSSLNSPEQQQSPQDTQRKKFLETYSLAAQMLKNIKISENDKENLENLKKEFMNSGFVYTMTATNPEKFLQGAKEGDCSTLARAYVKIAQEYFGIKDVKTCSKSGDFFVPNGGEVLDMNKATGNVDNGKHWVFTNHYWVESPIGTIDLLFLGREVNQSQWIDKTGEDKEDGIDYRSFKDYKVYEANYMSQTLGDKYATDLNGAQKGKKAADEKMKALFKK